MALNDGHGLDWNVGGQGSVDRPDPSVSGFQSGGGQVGTPPKIDKPNPADFGPPTIEGQAPGIIAKQQAAIKRTQPSRDQAQKDQNYRGKLNHANSVVHMTNGIHPQTEVYQAEQFIDNDKKNDLLSTDKGTDAYIDHRDSVLADPLNVAHFGQNAVDQAVQDSTNQAQSIDAMKGSVASGSENITSKPVGKARFPNFGK